MPVMPQNDAGWRIEPPVSVPVAAGARRAGPGTGAPPGGAAGGGAAGPGGGRRGGGGGVVWGPAAAGAGRAAPAPARPREGPPGMRLRSQGLRTGAGPGWPQGATAEFSLDEPIANSSQLSLPSVTAPACASWRTTVASNGDW